MFYLEWVIVTHSLFLMQATLTEVLACQFSLKQGIERGLSSGCLCAWTYATDPGAAACFYLCFGSIEAWHRRQRWAKLNVGKITSNLPLHPPSVCVLCKTSGLQATSEGNQVEGSCKTSMCPICFSSMLVLVPNSVIPTCFWFNLASWQ